MLPRVALGAVARARAVVAPPGAGCFAAPVSVSFAAVSLPDSRDSWRKGKEQPAAQSGHVARNVVLTAPSGCAQGSPAAQVIPRCLVLVEGFSRHCLVAVAGDRVVLPVSMHAALVAA